MRSVGLHAFHPSGIVPSLQHIGVSQSGFLPGHLRDIAAGGEPVKQRIERMHL